MLSTLSSYGMMLMMLALALFAVEGTSPLARGAERGGVVTGNDQFTHDSSAKLTHRQYLRSTRVNDSRSDHRHRRLSFADDDTCQSAAVDGLVMQPHEPYYHAAILKASPTEVMDHQFDWAGITSKHNHHHISNMYPGMGELFDSFKGMGIPALTALLNKDIIDKTVQKQFGSFEAFRTNIYHQVIQILKKEKSALDLKILFIGGSSCEGFGCSPEVEGLPEDAYWKICNYCGWPHRFVQFLRAALLMILPVDEVRLFPRYCCQGGSSILNGLNVVKLHEYSTSSCRRDKIFPNYTEPEEIDTSWEPDLIFYDYAVNDGNEQFFIKYQHPRKDAYDEFVREGLKISSRPQIISLNFLHGYYNNDVGTAERLETNQKYCVPMVDYMDGLDHNIAEHTPFFAAQLKDNHPFWPTHVRRHGHHYITTSQQNPHLRYLFFLLLQIPRTVFNLLYFIQILLP